MMMKMLDAGGMQVVVDNIRTADEDNPEGYYEFERVKQIEQDQAWLQEAQGKVVKMIAALLKHLPSDYQYDIIFMRRKIEEVLASQRQMLIRRGEPTDTISDAQMAGLFEHHVQRIETWLNAQTNMQVLYVNYSDVLKKPEEEARRVNEFLGGTLAVDSMADVVDPGLYRQRK
jgi:Sulfotransferase family